MAAAKRFFDKAMGANGNPDKGAAPKPNLVFQLVERLTVRRWGMRR